MRIRTRLPWSTVKWKELKSGRSLNRRLRGLCVNLGDLNKKCEEWERSSSAAVCKLVTPSKLSLFARWGFRVEPYWVFGVPLERSWIMNDTAESSAHINRLRPTVTAMMERKRDKQTGNKSWGRKPMVYAKDDIPDVAFRGSANKIFDMLVSMNSGEF